MAYNDSRIPAAVSELLKLFGIYLCKVWHVDDIHALCRQHRLRQLTNREAFEVFERASRQDATKSGVSHDLLEKALLDYVEATGKKVVTLEM